MQRPGALMSSNDRRSVQPDCKLSGTGVQREPDAESLLTRRTFGAFQFLRDPARSRLLARHRFQFANFARRPGAPLFCSLGHKTSLSTNAACIPYGSE